MFWQPRAIYVLIKMGRTRSRAQKKRMKSCVNSQKHQCETFCSLLVLLTYHLQLGTCCRRFTFMVHGIKYKNFSSLACGTYGSPFSIKKSLDPCNVSNANLAAKKVRFILIKCCKSSAPCTGSPCITSVTTPTICIGKITSLTAN